MWPLEQGYSTLQDKHRQLYQSIMPCTCKDVTTADNAVMHPAIASLVTEVHVDRQGWFDTHHPVLFALNIPHLQICRQQIK